MVADPIPFNAVNPEIKLINQSPKTANIQAARNKPASLLELKATNVRAISEITFIDVTAVQILFATENSFLSFKCIKIENDSATIYRTAKTNSAESSNMEFMPRLIIQFIPNQTDAISTME